jgi:acyl-CoA synthetase (AMP-forming)/AMP-acid ligase II
VGAEFAATLAGVRDRLPKVREVVVLGGDGDEYEQWLAAAEPVTGPYESAPEDCFLQLYTSGTTGGSPMPAPLMERTLNVLPTPLYSVYGMTETSGVFCVLGPDEHRDQRRTHLRASAGRPLPGNQVRVADPATGTEVRPGEVGEFWVRSDQVMAGYWNMPEATREAARPAQFTRIT